ncbi:MAG: CHASE2 domain-containing protein [Nitrospirae bacterium]|nr:CHASE2 domain-containing protein [Nitrospirota bacterium]
MIRKFFSYVNFTEFSSEQKWHFGFNILMGVIIAVIFCFLEHTGYGENGLNRLFDLFIRQQARDYKTVSPQKDKPKIVFIDFDQESLRDSPKQSEGIPLITPRDKIAGLINLANKANARVIIPDVFFFSSDCCNAGADGKLGTALENIKLENAKRKVKTKLILPVRIDAHNNTYHNIFKKLIDNENIYPAIPDFSATLSDGTVRYWVTYRKAKSGVGQNDEILWSIPVLASVLANDDAGSTLEKLRNIEKDFISVNKISKPATINIKGKDFELPLKSAYEEHNEAAFEELFLQRIRYLLRPPSLKENHDASEDGNLGFERLTVSDLKPLIAEGDSKIKEEAFNKFKDKIEGNIVIIGNSTSDFADIHNTPVGDMAGMYIHGNSIFTILDGKQVREMPGMLSISIEIFTIILTAYIFLYLQALSAKIVATIIMLAIFGPLSWYMFIHTNVLINVVFIISGIGLHKMVADFEAIIKLNDHNNAH